MQNKLFLYLLLSFALLAGLAVWSLYSGVFVFEKHSFLEIFSGIWTNDGSIDASERFVLMDLRLPRIAMGILIGSALAVSGTCLQGMFRNPLATPDLLGITAGASLFAAVTIVLGSYIKPYIPEALHYSLLSVMAFAGALITMILVYRISTQGGRTNIVMMLLSGVAITAIGFAVMGLLIYFAKDDELRDLTFWNLGSLAGATWIKCAILALVVLVAYSMLIKKGKALNAMMLGERDAQHLGIPVERIKKQIVVLTALMVGTSVAFAGTISFVGLIVPYILRLIFKSNYHIILPLAAVWGAILMLSADTISRTVAAPGELPIGVLTAFMGAPIFMMILIRNRKQM
ncbi:iron ABC transporter [Flavobacterium akiainvivens]|uniref:Iron ABC transporter n=1 Tax=Flavobacterium akiainvivens TaxID=1202724 RepID=A0A0N0RQV2_9FLAO|nr:iron ABC transporter permease [Flavobacterium akiainvivens]KOS06949.1 iron ABC transporter [Flavobacterium akiainvivens]SFQ60166.1 iron complex transport system permease protein [Flavobacterium akiainvivens]